MDGYLKNRQLKFLSKEIKIAIRKEIRKDCRQEAIKILELSEDKDREDFLKYYNEDKGNICCMVLDFAKKKLVDAGKLEQKATDCFKDPIMEF
jgi:ribosomal protein L22